MYGTPNIAGSPSGITKNPDNLSLFLCLIIALHLLCVMFVCCMCVIQLFTSCFANYSLVAMGNNILNIFIGIRLQSLLFLLCIHFCFLLSATSFVIMFDLFLLKCRDFIFTMNIYLSILSFEFCQLSSCFVVFLFKGLIFCAGGLPIFGLLLHTLLRWVVWTSTVSALSFNLSCCIQLCATFTFVLYLFGSSLWLPVI